jgi:hypothetical protein
MGGEMRLLCIAGAIVALALLACSGPTEPAPGTGSEASSTETPEHTQSPPTAAPPTPKSSENTLIETPEYTGVIISEKGASEFHYMFDEDTEFWQPSIDDISKAEACIRRFLDSAPDNPDLDAYRKANAPFILEHLQEYRRQYVGIVVDGEKRIWCNAFWPRDSYPDWQRLPVYVLDGGRDFWVIEYVLDRDECTDFYVHGEA